MKLLDLRIQNLNNPLGIGTQRPVFSYMLHSEKSGDKQTAYRILAASDEALLMEAKADLWDSGKVHSEDSFGIQYAGKTLQSRQIIFWKVQVWDRWGEASDWSEIAWFELSLLEKQDWREPWIGRAEGEETNQSAALMAAAEFWVEKMDRVKRARLYISGLGLFRASVNGCDLADSLYDPGESDYGKRVYFVTYDLMPFLAEGKNILGVLLGNGQYVNYAVHPVMKLPDDTLSVFHRYQKDDSILMKNGICGRKKLIAQIELTMEDGRLEHLRIGKEGWRMTDSAITFQSWYGGEDYDGLRAMLLKGWNQKGFDRSSWSIAVELEPPEGKLVPREFLPVQITETWTPSSLKALKNGNWLVDFGKNSAGFVRLKLWSTEQYAGTRVELYPAEVVGQDSGQKLVVDQGSCTQSCSSLYDCTICDSYTIAGMGVEEWQPLFGYHGFQYVEVCGFPGVPQLQNFEGCAVRLNNKKTGTFETDHEIMNRIHEITERSIESNMMFCFTDCPQIEKLGWLETTHLMFASMASGYDLRSWIPKIAADMRDAQVTGEEERDQRYHIGNPYERYRLYQKEEPGFMPGIAPEYFRIGNLYKDPNWGGACIMTPWYYYLEYGDEDILRRNYTMMINYCRHLDQQAQNGVLEEYAQMGEWGQLHEETPAVLVATCAYYLLTDKMASIAAILRDEVQRCYYEVRKNEIRQGFHQNKKCFNEEKGIYGNHSQASYGCVLFSGIFDPDNEELALCGLKKAIAVREDHLSSGEVGLKQVFCALAECGENELVYRMVMNQTQPSYRYFIEEGLTTLPEYWDYTELRDGHWRSRNHAMMGHVKEWLCRYVMGIRPLEAGYKKTLIKPWLHDEMNRIQGSVGTVRGSVGLIISRTKEELHMQIQIPPGVTAEVWVPFESGQNCRWDSRLGSCNKIEDSGYLRFQEVPSGCYEWKVVG